MPAIQNQDTNLIHLITIDGEEITEHNRRFAGSVFQTGADVELARGVYKRYIQKNKKSFTLTFSYLPSLITHTVDGRKGQAYLKDKAEKKGTVAVTLKVDPNEPVQSYTCFIESYSENLVKRDILSGCSYYDVSVNLVEQ